MDIAQPPSMEELISVLADITGRDDLRTDVRLADLGLDSMDILQWLFALEDELGIEFDEILGEESELEAFGEATLGQLYDTLLGLLATSSGVQVGGQGKEPVLRSGDGS